MPDAKSRTLSFADAITEATTEAMREDESVILYGLGVNDPGRVFGTTQGLLEEFGPSRVFETPTAENAMTGIAVGAALGGLRPIVTHQRFDFFLLAMDQLVNSAAKWRYMFGGQFEVPIVIRLITGRGWGQGPTHSQSFHSWLAHVPGLKVVVPSNPGDAKAMLKSSIADPNPVVFIENRWLHNKTGLVPKISAVDSLGMSRVVRRGTDVTIVALGMMVDEAISAADKLDSHGVSCEVIDIRSVNPLDRSTIGASAKKTGRLLALDFSHNSGSVVHTLISGLLEDFSAQDMVAARTLTVEDIPQPTSFSVSESWYPSMSQIFVAVLELMGEESASGLRLSSLTLEGDQSQLPFDGPF